MKVRTATILNDEKDRTPDKPLEILPVPENMARPLWSVMIPAYNCAKYLKQTMQSVLDQDLGENLMQIEVVDDFSTDEDVRILVEVYGKGRISYFKQPKNIGSLRNFQTCINRARGHYVHLLHGDDKVNPCFYETVTKLIHSHPAAGAIITGWETINENNEVIERAEIIAKQPGVLKEAFKLISHGTITQYVSTVVKRSVYEELGSFYAVTYGEDWIMWARIAKFYSIIYTPQVLSQYRIHQTSISGMYELTGKNFKQIKVVARIVASLGPEKDYKRVVKNIQQNYIHWSVEKAYNTWAKHPNSHLLYSRLTNLLYHNRSLNTIKLILIRILHLLFISQKKTAD